MRVRVFSVDTINMSMKLAALAAALQLLVQRLARNTRSPDRRIIPISHGRLLCLSIHLLCMYILSVAHEPKIVYMMLKPSTAGMGHVLNRQCRRLKTGCKIQVSDGR